MAAFFIDLDGTVLKYHTNEFLPGVVDRLSALVSAGHEVIFISMRGTRDLHDEWSPKKTREALATLPFPYRFLGDVQAPRILIDDTAPTAVHATTNDPTSWLGQS